MYSSLSSPTHHIFFPPRLEVVVEEQNPDGLPSHAWDQSPFDGFLRHQAHGPAGAAFGRIAAHHGDDPLLLTLVEHSGRAGTLLFEQRRLQTAALVTTGNRADGLRSQWDDPGNPRRAGAFGQLQQREGSEDDPNLLNPTGKQLTEFFLVLWCDIDTQRWTTHTRSMRQNNST